MLLSMFYLLFISCFTVSYLRLFLVSHVRKKNKKIVYPFKHLYLFDDNWSHSDYDKSFKNCNCSERIKKWCSCIVVVATELSLTVTARYTISDLQNFLICICYFDITLLSITLSIIHYNMCDVGYQCISSNNKTVLMLYASSQRQGYIKWHLVI